MEVPPESVVVGVDGSADSLRAVDWAFTEAIEQGRPLHLMHVAAPAMFQGDALPTTEREMRERGEQAIAAATQRRPAGSEVEVTSSLVDGTPAKVLIDASSQAQLVVVGSRGHGGFAGLLLGSVSGHVARHAKCAVAVVKATADPQATRIIVGVDFSESGQDALARGFRMAAERGVRLTAIHTWLDVSESGARVMFPREEDVVERTQEGTRHLQRAVADWQGKHPQVQVNLEVIPGHAARVLADASEHAVAVVVGSRGLGSFTGMLLGSTSHSLLHLAHCPVVVAR